MVVLALIKAHTISVAFFARAHLLALAGADVEKLCHSERRLVLEACVENLQNKRQEALRTPLSNWLDLG